jgi:hypothetical protein
MDARRRSFPTNSQQFFLFFSRLGRNPRISVVVGDFFGEHLANRACIMAEYSSPLNARYFAVGRITRSLAPPKSATTYNNTHSVARSLTYLLTYCTTALVLSAMTTCSSYEQVELGPLAIDYLGLYYCSWLGGGVLVPLLFLLWALFLIYLCE